MTISESTRDDLLRLGVSARIDVLPMAVNTEAVAELPAKRLEGHLLAIGRLAPSKRYDHAIRALAELRRTHPRATLTIIGDGPERERLERLARELDLVGCRTAGRKGRRSREDATPDRIGSARRDVRARGLGTDGHGGGGPGNAVGRVRRSGLSRLRRARANGPADPAPTPPRSQSQHVAASRTLRSTSACGRPHGEGPASSAGSTRSKRSTRPSAPPWTWPGQGARSTNTFVAARLRDSREITRSGGNLHTYVGLTRTISKPASSTSSRSAR